MINPKLIGNSGDNNQQNGQEIFHFIDRNKSILAIIALFSGLSGFILNITRENPNDSLIYGIVSLFFLVGLLIAYVIYDACKILNRLFFLPSDDPISAFQSVFIILFTMFLIIPLISLMNYFSKTYPDKVTWLLIGASFCVVVFSSMVFNGWIYSRLKKHDKLKRCLFPFFAIGSFAILFINRGLGIPQFVSGIFPDPAQAMLIYTLLASYFLYSTFYFFRRND